MHNGEVLSIWTFLLKITNVKSYKGKYEKEEERGMKKRLLSVVLCMAVTAGMLHRMRKQGKR